MPAGSSGDPPDQHIFDELTGRVPPSPSLTADYLVEHAKLPRQVAKKAAIKLKRSGAALVPIDVPTRKPSRALVPIQIDNALIVSPTKNTLPAVIATETITIEERRALGVDAGCSLGSYNKDRGVELPKAWLKIFAGSVRKTTMVRWTFWTFVAVGVVMGVLNYAGMWRPTWSMLTSYFTSPKAQAVAIKPKPQKPDVETREIVRKQLDR